MSKHKHSRNNPHKSAPRPNKQEANVNRLSVTVAVSPESDANVKREIQMVKAALLYADSVTLCSVAVSSVLATRDPQRMSERQRNKLLVQVSPLVGYSHEQAHSLEQLLNFSENPYALPPYQRTLLKEVQARVSSGWKGIAAKADEIYKDTGLDSLLPVMESGLVKVQALPVRLFDILATAVDRSLSRANTEEAARRYFEIVTRAIASSDTHLLLDEQTGELVRAAISEGKLHPTAFQSARTRHVGFSAQVLQSLPTFDYATIDEVVHIREQLHSALVRFRAAMIDFSSTFQCAIWDADFQQEAELVFRQRVEPALLDLEEEMKSNTFIRQLVTKAKQSKILFPSGTVSASSLVVQMSHLASLTDLAHLILVGAGSSMVGELAHVVIDAENDWRNRHQELERNHMYFAYRANQMMGR